MGLAWYSPDAWRELCAMPEAGIEITYPEYVRKFERLLAGYAAQGFRVVKVPVDVTLMVAWCRRHGYDIDDKGRAVFGAALMCARDAGQDVMTMPVEDPTRTVQ